MARYRKIDVRLWIDDRFQRLSPIPPCGQGLWLYLLTNPDTTNIPGLYRAGESGMAEALGWSLKGFRDAFREAYALGMVEADWNARVIWIPKAITYHRPESLNVVKGWATPWDEIPDCALKRKAYQELKAYVEAMSDAYGDAFAQAFAKPSGIQEQEQEQEQEHIEKSAANGVARSTRKAPKSDPPQELSEPDHQRVVAWCSEVMPVGFKFGGSLEGDIEDCLRWHRKNGVQRVDWADTAIDWIRRNENERRKQRGKEALRSLADSRKLNASVRKDHADREQPRLA